MHPLVIHSYPSRSYRNPESLEEVWIKIPVCCCDEAKARGLQYTKRLLPDFLIPFARMRLDKVIEAGRRKESGSTLEECCRIIGCTTISFFPPLLSPFAIVHKWLESTTEFKASQGNDGIRTPNGPMHTRLFDPGTNNMLAS